MSRVAAGQLRYVDGSAGHAGAQARPLGTSQWGCNRPFTLACVSEMVRRIEAIILQPNDPFVVGASFPGSPCCLGTNQGLDL